MGWPDEPFLNLRQTATPKGTPANGGMLLYVKGDGKIYTKDATGVETEVTALVAANLAAHIAATAAHGATGAVVGTKNTQTLTNKTLTSPVIDTIIGSNGLTAATFVSVASAVNSIQIANNIATGAARLIAQGSDTNISINIVPKGTGTLKQNGVDVLTTTGTQTVTNKTLSTGILVGAATTDISGAWTTYTPTWANLTVGNGTVVADYVQIGKTVHWRVSVTFGSTTALGGSGVAFSLPVASASHRWRFDGEILDAGIANYPIQGRIVPTTSTSNVELVFRSNSSLSDSLVTGAAGAPFLMGTGDIISISGTYQAA